MDANNVFLNTLQTSSAPKIFFFPHSGSGPGIYMNWKKHLENFNIIGVQYPGRGSRIIEDFSSSIQELVDSLYNNYDWKSITENYFFFGHSLGAIVAYELAKKIEENSIKPPKSVIVSALPSPSSEAYKKRVKVIDNNEAITMISSFSTEMKEEFIKNEDLLEMFMEIINADISLLDTYIDTKNNSITSNIHALGGLNDSISKNQLENWQMFTSSEFSLNLFEGGHFYFNNNFEAFINTLKSIILNQSQHHDIQHI